MKLPEGRSLPSESRHPARGEASRRKPKDAARGEASRRTFASFGKPPEVKLPEGRSETSSTSYRKPPEVKLPEGSKRCS